MKLTTISRKRQHLAMVVVFLASMTLIAGMAGCGGEWNPTIPPSQNLEIQTWYDLNAVTDNPAGNHTLMNDLDSTTAGYEQLASPTANGGKGWEPIATYVPEGGFVGFMGTFDGQGHARYATCLSTALTRILSACSVQFCPPGHIDSTAKGSSEISAW